MVNMSRRAHWWLRLGGIGVIVVAELLPRLGSRDAAAKVSGSAASAPTGSTQAGSVQVAER
jgi:hypothetical protein